MTHQVVKTVNSFLSRDTPVRQGVDRLDLLSTNYLETSVYGGINSTMLVSIINALNGKKRIFILDDFVIDDIVNYREFTLVPMSEFVRTLTDQKGSVWTDDKTDLICLSCRRFNHSLLWLLAGKMLDRPPTNRVVYINYYNPKLKRDSLT